MTPPGGRAAGQVDGYAPAAQSAASPGPRVSERARMESAIVYVVDDEPSIRDSTKELAESIGLRVQTFATAQEFLVSQRPDVPGCLVLDVRMPGLSGFDLQGELAKTNNPVPIIFISAHADADVRALALQAGAVDFFEKPFSSTALLEAIAAASRAPGGAGK